MEGPTEKKFEAQSKELHALRQQIEQVNARVDENVAQQQSFQQKVEKSFHEVRSEISNTTTKLRQSFEQSLMLAMQNQDKKLQDNFSDLKALIVASKAKTSPKKKK